MPNSNGVEASEKPQPPQKGKNSEKNKRKRIRNRKKNAEKVENLVSKTFQAKLANACQPENPIVNDQVEVKAAAQTKIVQCANKNVPTKITSPVDNSLKNKSSREPKSIPCKEDILLIAKEKVPVETLNKSTKFELVSKPLLPKEEKLPLNNTGDILIVPHSLNSTMVPTSTVTSAEKSREEILAEREAKKLAKLQAKKKNKDKIATSSEKVIVTEAECKVEANNLTIEGTSVQISKNEIKKKELYGRNLTTTIAENLNTVVMSNTPIIGESKIKDKKPTLTKAERRAIQEAQRAAKSDSAVVKKPASKPIKTINDRKPVAQSKEVAVIRTEKSPVTKPTKDCKVKLFNHLETCRKDSNLFINNPHIHPIIVRLGEQYAKRTIVGSNSRCIAFLNALKTVIKDYETPAKKEFARSLEATIKIAVDHLHKCRPLAVSVWNAYKHIKHVLTQLSVEQPESELKEHLCHFVDTYIENQIGKAAEAISISVQDKISNGDVILTFGCSSLINYIFEEAHRRHVDFRVIVVDSRPFLEGQELLRRLTAKEIPCTYVLINAVGFVMPEVTKILLGAHALLSNGYVMARTGTAQVALVARSFNVPVLVCCETHKFSERFQTDAIVYNELGNPDDLVMSDKCRLMNWQSQNKLSPLNLNYDITPPELVTAVVTEVAILPCTSVPVILRIKPTEIGY